MVYLTIYFATAANVNVGVITTIWSVDPINMAIVDYYLFGQKLKYFHVIGVSSIFVCSLLISLSGYLEGDKPAETIESEAYAPTWIPVLFGILAPISFTTFQTYCKHLTSPRLNFKSDQLTFSSYLCVNLVILVVAIVYWNVSGKFQKNLFYYGFVSGSFDAFGSMMLLKAIGSGPAGPVCSIVALSSIMLAIVQALRFWKMLSTIELLGLIFGTFGGLILVIPEWFEKYFFCCCIKRRVAP
jgi:drug/metabolite transporter (DMT)-like permease